LYSLVLLIQDPEVTAVCGTWAHGLYLATEVALLASNASMRVEVAIPWEFLGDASMGSIFATSSGFAFTGSPNQNLPTTPYNRSATGFTLGSFAAASKGRTSAAGLTFSPNPPANGVNGLIYGTIVGVAFSGGPGLSAAVLNLGASIYQLNISNIGTFKRYETSSATPTAPVNMDAVVKVVQGAPGDILTLPPFSITVLT
jgi:hypothetical protein